jgi:hypothetical protein
MHKITTASFTELDLGDIRRNERFVTIINNVIEHSGQSIPQQNKDWYGAKATYHFFSNDQISLKELQKAIHAYGAASIPTDSDCVLVIHDTSNISYNELNAEGLGYLDNKSGRGILLHSSIGVSNQGIPLGLLHQQIWTRPVEELGKAIERKSKRIEDKESNKWLRGINTCNELLGQTIKKVHIADREADIYELFFMRPEYNSELLVRACQPRRTDEGLLLWNQISKLPLNSTIPLQIPDIVGHKKADILMEVRYKQIKLLCPKSKKNQYDSVELTAIEVREQSDKDDALCWRLLTTLDVKSIEDVKLYIKWYTYRWLIERFHYVIKSGCKIEALQLKQADSLKKAIVMYSLAGFIIMQLTYQSRETPGASCEVILAKVEWQALYIRIHGTNTLPQIPPTLQQATLWIGKLGGHLGRKSDGPPGVKTIWRGYQELKSFLDLYLIMTRQQNLGND